MSHVWMLSCHRRFLVADMQLLKALSVGPLVCLLVCLLAPEGEALSVCPLVCLLVCCLLVCLSVGS